VCLIAMIAGMLGPAAAQGPGASATATATANATSTAMAKAGAVPAAVVEMSGRAPMPGDAEVPIAWMPPGSRVSPIPSDEIFPTQTITLRFNHKKHVKELQLQCKACHPGAYTSEVATDRILPKPADSCDACHDVDHSDLDHVKAGEDAISQCKFCHLGAAAGVGGKVAPVVLPAPNLRFNHKKHLARNIQCGQCHGQVGELELATRDQMPRMAGCFTCHNMSGAARGDAKGTCTTCHLTQVDGRLQTAFSSGSLLPPRWLHASAHDADWIERHKLVAADDSQFCGSCHTSKDCTDCHDGRVRPRKVHPNDWLSMHPQAARQDNPRCSSCHQEQTFCADCHRRTGVARDAAGGNRAAGRRFHPPPAVWSNAPRGPMHHAWEAARNLNACVSCHTERDCTTCHATKGLAGGQGVNPHPTGFRDKCGLALRRNPRPCLVCHASSDAFVGMCR
jgi:hypothetical protein